MSRTSNEYQSKNDAGQSKWHSIENHPSFSELSEAAAAIGEFVSAPDGKPLRSRRIPENLRRLAYRVAEFWGASEGLGGICGVGVGVAGGNSPNQPPALTLYVREARRFKRKFGNFQHFFAPGGTTKHAIRIEEIGLFEQAGRGYARPAHIGCSAGHCVQSGGSIGCVVRDRESPEGRKLLLSAAHVFASSNRSRPGEEIIQPSRRHGGGKQVQDVLAKLVRYVRLTNGEIGDIAVAEPLDQEHIHASLWPTKHVPTSGRAPKMREPVVMYYGAGSDNADPINGEVVTANTTVVIRFEGFGWVTLRNMCLTKMQINTGDSGTGLFGSDGALVGIVSGLSVSGLTAMTPYPTIASRLKVEV